MTDKKKNECTDSVAETEEVVTSGSEEAMAAEEAPVAEEVPTAEAEAATEDTPETSAESEVVSGSKKSKKAQKEKKPKKKKDKKKVAIVTSVVAVILVAAGAGFFVWHEQPSFCNAICHTPMDAYYETYDEGATDKWGNELDDAGRSSMMAFTHKDAGLACMDCHIPTIGEQIAEGAAWVTGDYAIAGEMVNGSGMAYLDKRSLKDLTEARDVPAESFCMNEACHLNEDGSVMTYDDLAALTADLSETRNPHQFQHGKYECSVCHQAHGQSVNYCSGCHPNDSPIPEGWLSVAEAKQLHQ